MKSPVSQRLTITALLLLTFATGLVDAVSVLVLGHVFVANMTGNVIFLGFWFVPHSGVDLTAALVAFLSFITGAVIGGRMVRHRGPSARRWLPTALAVEVARRVSDVPIVASISFDAQQQTLAGQGVEEVTTHLAALGVDVIGANCSVGPVQMMETLRRMRAAAPDARLSVAPNAGLPLMRENQAARYPVGPEEFGEYTAYFLAQGASIVGGCCGTTPVYTAAMRRIVSSPAP